MKRVKLGISGSLVFLTVAIAFVPVTTAAAQGNQPQAIAEKASSLIGTQWMLVKLDGKPIPHGGLQPYFALKGGEQLASGSTGQLVDTSDGCNDLTGFYEIRGDSLNIHVVAATLLTCRTSGRIPVKRENGGPAPAHARARAGQGLDQARARRPRRRLAARGGGRGRSSS